MRKIKKLTEKEKQERREYGALVNARITALKISKVALAEFIGIRVDQFWRITDGQRPTSPEVKKAIAVVFEEYEKAELRIKKRVFK